MHIEPGVVDGAKIALSYVTAAGAAGLAARMAWQTLKSDGLFPLATRSALATLAAFAFFEVLPHAPVGVSEVHLIFGATLVLVLGAGPAAIGLALGLLAQGLFFAPADLPQYAMNATTLIVPLWAVTALAGRMIPSGTAYVDLRARDVAALSAAYQGGVVAWVAFWAFYGQGIGVSGQVASFGVSYLPVIAFETLAAVTLLAGAKALAVRGPWLVSRQFARS